MLLAALLFGPFPSREGSASVKIEHFTQTLRWIGGGGSKLGKKGEQWGGKGKQI